MLLRDAVTPPPDLKSARRVAVAVGITAALVFGGAAIAALNFDRPRIASAELPAVTVPSVDYAIAFATEQELALARRELAGYAFETFPQWVAANPARACPLHLLELNAYDPTLHAVDPWGRPYQFACTPRLWARSAGPDRVFDTSDDLTSTP